MKRWKTNIDDTILKNLAGRSILSKVYMEMWKTRIDNTILKKDEVGGLSWPDFETYYKVTVIDTGWYWWKTRQINGTT
jgi:hypothetical protein